eukprot:2968527-Pyramimonas_sp.AAC.1
MGCVSAPVVHSWGWQAGDPELQAVAAGYLVPVAAQHGAGALPPVRHSWRRQVQVRGQGGRLQPTGCSLG